MTLRRNSLVYEINTIVWLNELRTRYGKTFTLADIPDEVVDALAACHFDAIWMMGIWERSPRGREIALYHPDLQNEYRRALPNLTPEHVVGSPYAVGRYSVDPRFGGREALASFRRRLADRGIKLILDYVPNHVAVDHPWTVDVPEALVQGSEQDLANRAGHYFPVKTNGHRRVFAHGRDPYFPAWTDTAQIDAFSPEARRITIQTLLDIAQQCDGVRCDMVMLLVSRIFAGTWSRGSQPVTEFWAEVIPAVKAAYPDFTFLAEVYWDMEAELQNLGFDYTYDKRLYDRMLHETTQSIRDHLTAPMHYQNRMVRFIENHDEARALAAFGPQKSRAAATVIATLPGMKLFHQGQFEGRRVRLPVQLGIAPEEPVVESLSQFYRHLLTEAASSPYRDGVFMMLSMQPAPGASNGAAKLLAYAWAKGADWRVVIANLGEEIAEGRLLVPRPEFGGSGAWRFENVLNAKDVHQHDGDDLLTGGLPLRLDAHTTHIYRVRRAD